MAIFGKYSMAIYKIRREEASRYSLRWEIERTFLDVNSSGMQATEIMMLPSA